MRYVCLLVQILLVSACLLGAPSGAHAQTAEKIIADNIAASGGEEAITRNFRFAGRMTVESPFFGKLEGTLEATRVPGRGYYEHVVLGPIQQSKGWDGTRGWEQSPAGVRMLDGAELTALTTQSFVNPLVALRTLAPAGLQIERLADADVRARPHYVLAVKTADGPASTMYIDRQTNLLTRASTMVTIPNVGEAPSVTDVGDYEVVAGVKMPTTVTVTVEGISTTRLTVHGTAITTAVDAAIFHVPAGGATPATASAAPAAAPATSAGQTSPRFEVASIRPSGDLTQQSRGGLSITQRQARFSLLSLNDYIGIAFKLRLHQIVGPDWLASARFDIVATIPENQQGDQLAGMLRALLEERFTLRTHRESREFSVYALEVAAGGSKLIKLPEDKPTDAPFTVSSGPTAGGLGAAVDLGQGSTLMLGNNRFEAKKVTMATLADVLGRFVDRPVVDRTNLDGRYDVAFEVQPDDFIAMMIRSAVAAGLQMPPEALQRLDTASIAAVPDALKALGLSLTPRRAPIEVLVVDSMEKLPTEN